MENSYFSFDDNKLHKILKNKIKQLAAAREHRDIRRENNLLLDIRSIEYVMNNRRHAVKKPIWTL